MKKILLPGVSILLLLIGVQLIGVDGYCQTTTFAYTGGVQTYTVAAGVTSITVDVRGAQGGGVECYLHDFQSLGGCGGRVQATVAVTAGHVLNIIVGGMGANTATGGVAAGGYGGGGSDDNYSGGTEGFPGAGGGGGTTIIDITTGTTLVVAGGGGGGGGDYCTAAGEETRDGDVGGAGGGLTGATGNSNFCGTGFGGGGGTPTLGGAGGVCNTYTGTAGTAGIGGNSTTTSGEGSGGGGGGWYGGGSGAFGGGGGGGSSYTEAGVVTGVTHTQGYNCADGTAIITVSCSAGTITGTNKVCVGSITDLTDATTGGTWSSSNTTVATVGSTTGVVTGIGGGTVTISYIMPAGCYAIYAVTVNPNPTIINGATIVCAGLTTTLTDATGVGTWTSGTTSIAIVGSSSGIVTGETSGTTEITYTITSTGCYTVTPVTVNPTPANIAGTLSVCSGFTTTLSDITTPGTWSSTTIAIGSSTGVVTGGTTGTATITYTASNGCYVTAIVTVNTQPVMITDNTGPICATYTETLSDGTTGGTWSVSNGNATIGAGTGIVTGVTPVLDTVTYALSTGCFVTTVVTINPLPAVITGSLTVCSGLTTTLSDITTPGTWTSSSGSIAGVGSGTGVVTGGTAGTATITYSISTGCYVTAIVTVDPLPAAIGGILSVCVGSTTTLTDATSGGTWMASNGNATFGTGTGILTGVIPGLDTVTYTLATGCIITAVVTVDPLPTSILGIDSVCAGLTTSLSDAGGGTWSSINTTVATVGSSSGIVTGGGVLTSDTVTIVYTIGTGCATTVVITVNPLPTAILGIDSVCLGLTTSLSDASGGTWSSGNTGVATIGSSTGLVTAVGTGTATIINVLVTGCSRSIVVTVNPLPTAILGIDSVCSGLTTTLSDAGGGTWSSSNTTVATVGLTTGVVTGETVLTSTTVTITYTLPTSCITTVIVTVNPLPTAILGVLKVCSGLTTTLSDAGGGTWSSSNTTVATVGSSTGIVTGETVLTATTVTITYTLPTGCHITATVTVDPLPTAILGVLSVCSGLTTTLSDAGGGTWTSGNTTIAIIGSTSGVVTGETVGSASTVTITYTLPTGCIITAIVTVNPLPTAILGIDSVCSGLTTTLSDAGGGTWSSSNTTTATVGSSSGVVTGGTVAASTTVIITYTLGTGCITTVTVTVNPLPGVINGNLQVCMGLTTSLTDATAGGTWSASNGNVLIGTTTGVVTGESAGTSIITYTLITGCIETAIVTVNPLPNAITGTLTVCSGSATDLFDTPGGGTWSSSNTAVATVGATTGVVTGQVVVVTSTATITYTLNTGCIMTAVVTVNPLPTAILGPNAVCLGSTVTLSDAGGGTWTSANPGIASVGSATGIVMGNTVGVTTITYTLSTGCYITAPMTVNPLPSAISGPTVVCPFATIALSDGSSGGTWTSSNGSIATVGLTTGIVTGQSAGTVTITYTLNTGCDVTYTITVNPAPVPLITPVGDTIFCPGSFVALTANTGAGLNYQWYVGGIAIPGALSSSYIATLAGSYQVFETNSFGCSTFSTPMSVTIDTPVAVITASSGTTICSGTSITLNANIGAGLSYQWLLGGVVITGAVGSSYTTNTGGDYSVVVTNSTGCSATSNVIIITTIPSPTANITLSGPLTFCQGGSVVMTTGYATGYVYQWYNGAGMITGASSQTYTATATGTYYVIVTNSYGCSATSIVVSVVVNPLPDVAITASGSTVFCSGGSVTLIATAVGGDTYQWYEDGSLITGATNSSYLVTAGGGYQVQVTDPATGCTAETLADTTVTVVGTPVIIPVTPASFCWGGSALLTTSVSGAGSTITYQWYLNGVAIAGATGPTYNAAIPGNYSCQISIPGSCTVTTVAIPVTEYPLPNPVVTLEGGNLVIGNYYVTYQWYKNLVPIAGAVSYSTPCTGSGDYKVAVTDTNGCQSYSDVYVDTTCNAGGGGTTSVPNVSKGDIKIYPNPAQTMVHIESAVQVRAVVSSIDGRAILNIAAAKDIDISTLADGIYMIMLYDDNGIMVKAEKLVKTAN